MSEANTLKVFSENLFCKIYRKTSTTALNTAKRTCSISLIETFIVNFEQTSLIARVFPSLIHQMIGTSVMEELIQS